jgi:hypothetical protein
VPAFDEAEGRTNTMSGETHSRPGGAGSRRLRTSAVLALALAVAVGAWLLTRGAGHSTPAVPAAQAERTVGTVAPLGPVALTADGLKTLSAALRQPIYWAGAEAGDRYEFTETAKGYVYVRYLPSGVEVGDPRSDFLIVSTYPFPNALAALKAVADGAGRTLANGAFALPSRTYAKSVHLAYPDVGYQIEVYDPDPARARQVALSGRVRAIG